MLTTLYESSFRIDLIPLFTQIFFCLGSEKDAMIYTINLQEMQSFDQFTFQRDQKKKKNMSKIFFMAKQLMIEPQVVTSESLFQDTTGSSITFFIRCIKNVLLQEKQIQKIETDAEKQLYYLLGDC